MGQTPIGLKVRYYSRLSESHNPLQGFVLEVISLREMGIFRFPIYMGFRTIQHMISGFTGLLLRTHDPTFPNTAHIYALQNTSEPSLSAWYFTLKQTHDSMRQVGQT